MISTENKDAAQEEMNVVVKLKPEIKEQMLVLCERFPLKDTILIWMLLKKCTNNELILKEGIELEMFNLFIFRLSSEPYKDVANVLNYFVSLQNEETNETTD